MIKHKLALRRDTLRILTSLDGVAGGRVTSIPTLCYAADLRPDTRASEQAGGGPCPGEYSFACVP